MKFAEKFISYFNGDHTLFDAIMEYDQFNSLVRSMIECNNERHQRTMTVPTPVSRQSQPENKDSLNIYELMTVMNEFFEDVLECEIMDIFDLIQQNETIEFKHLYTFVLMFAAKESHSQLKFLYHYSQNLFEAIRQTNNKILGITFRMLMKVYGMPARQCQQLFQNLRIKMNEEYTYDEFEIFCFGALVDKKK